MTDVLNTFPTVGAQTLRALARYPDRIAFSWPGGSITYRGTTDLIARLQNVFMNLGAQPGTKVALLTANRADTWCAGRRGATVAFRNLLAASAGLDAGPDRPDRGRRSNDPDH